MTGRLFLEKRNVDFKFYQLNMRNSVLCCLQSSERGDVLNPLITGVFLEVRVLARVNQYVNICTHMHKHAQKTN